MCEWPVVCMLWLLGVLLEALNPVPMALSRLDGSMETTSEIVDSASHDCPLVTQTYGTAKGAYAPSSPTRLGKGQDTNLEGN